MKRFLLAIIVAIPLHSCCAMESISDQLFQQIQTNKPVETMLSTNKTAIWLQEKKVEIQIPTTHDPKIATYNTTPIALLYLRYLALNNKRDHQVLYSLYGMLGSKGKQKAIRLIQNLLNAMIAQSNAVLVAVIDEKEACNYSVTVSGLITQQKNTTYEFWDLQLSEDCIIKHIQDPSFNDYSIAKVIFNSLCTLY